MDWIKKNYEKALLALAALLLLATSGFIIFKTMNIGENFTAASGGTAPSDKASVPPLDMTGILDVEKRVEEPVAWGKKPPANEYLFVSKIYMIDGGVPKQPIEGAKYADTLTGSKIPNTFFVNNRLPLLDPTIPKQDADKDGFTNEDEWRGDRDLKDPTKWGGSTDPNDPKSHPEHMTKLFLKNWIRVPFVLLFQSYDGDPKKPETMSFQINGKGRSNKTEFPKLGEKVTSGPYKLEKFELKFRPNPTTNAEEDVSELTVLNTETGSRVVLVKEKPTDSPESLAEFDYQWNNSKPLQVRKLGPFVLQPNTNEIYKLIDINQAGALIRHPDGREYLVVPDKRAKP